MIFSSDICNLRENLKWTNWKKEHWENWPKAKLIFDKCKSNKFCSGSSFQWPILPEFAASFLETNCGQISIFDIVIFDTAILLSEIFLKRENIFWKSLLKALIFISRSKHLPKFSRNLCYSLLSLELLFKVCFYKFSQLIQLKK